MQEYLPELATLRRFADRIYWLFDTPKDYHQASCRRAAIVRDPAFQAVPELVKAMEQLSDGEVPQDHGLPEQPDQSAGADQQSCGADQPDGSVPGEGAVQVAAAKDAGPVRGVAAGRHLEPLGYARGPGDEISQGWPTTKRKPLPGKNLVESRENVVVFSEKCQNLGLGNALCQSRCYWSEDR